MDTDKLLAELSMLASQQDPETQKKILALKEQLAYLLEYQSAPHLAIRPQDIKQTQNLLPEVIDLVEIVKEILCNKSNGINKHIEQEIIVKERKKRNPNKSFEYSRLDAMERIYKNHGWKVSYKSSDYNENYFDAYFIFQAQS